MATRIAFSTHHPDRMGELAGRPTYFCEKIVKGLGLFTNGDEDFWAFINYMEKMGCFLSFEAHKLLSPKTTTIRSNYEYWKSKEGQLIQPFFWAGKPYRSKHVVFCPEVRLNKVKEIFIQPSTQNIIIVGFSPEGDKGNPNERFDQFVKDEGFDHPDHFWMWFDKDFSGAYLELESAKI